jgi:hypothetical protein
MMRKSIGDIPYMDILKKSWNITWNHKYLWWFGLFLALGGGNLGRMNYAADENNNKEYGQQTMQFMSAHLGLVITFGIILAVIFLVFVILGIIARGGIIKSLDHINKNQGAGFRSGMKEGEKYFWKLFVLSIILVAIILVSLIVLATPTIFLFVIGAWPLGIVLAFFAVVIMIPLIILATFLGTFGQFYIVLGELSPWPSIENSYELFKKNIAPSIIMGLLLAAAGLVAGMGILAVLFFFLVIFAGLGFIAYYIVGKIATIIIVAIGVLIFIAAALIIQSALQVFNQSAWLLFFREIAAPAEEEKAEEVIEEIEKEELPAAGDVVKTIGSEK